METIVDATLVLVILAFTLLIGSFLLLRRPPTVVYVVPSEDWAENRGLGCLPLLFTVGILLASLLILGG